MNHEMKEAVLQAAEYSNEDKKRVTRTVLAYLIIGMLALIVSVVLKFLEPESGFWLGFTEGACTGILFWALLMGILYATGSLNQVKAFKLRLLGRKGADGE